MEVVRTSVNGHSSNVKPAWIGDIWIGSNVEKDVNRTVLVDV
jgi:hypothetical protein